MPAPLLIPVMEANIRDLRARAEAMGNAALVADCDAALKDDDEDAAHRCCVALDGHDEATNNAR